MSEGKVKLPREVAEAITEASANRSGVECLHDILYMIRCVMEELPDSYAFKTIVDFYLKDNQNKVAYMMALVNGYEVEQTPEDKVKGLFNKPGPFHNGIGETSCAYRDGIRDTLDALGIKYEGVNS